MDNEIVKDRIDAPHGVSDKVRDLELTLAYFRREYDNLYRASKTTPKERESYEKRIEELEREQEILIWNLAGCSTTALGYGVEEKFSEDWARPALKDVAKLAKEHLQLKKLLKEYLIALDESPSSEKAWNKQRKALVALADAISFRAGEDEKESSTKKPVTFMDWWKSRIVNWDYNSASAAWSACRIATLDAIKEYFYGIGRSESAGLMEDLIRSFKDEEA